MSVAIFKGKLVKFLAKAGILVPARPDGDRSLTPVAGETAFNTTANKLEVYNGTAWEQLAAGGSGNGLVHPTTGSTYESGTANPSMDAVSALNNTAIGVNALNSVAFGSDNTVVGASAGDALTSGSNNNFFGVSSGRAVTNGIHNNYYGFQSGYNTTTAEYNIGIGSSSLFNMTSLPATANIAIGDSALYRVVSGINNVAIGSTSGFNYNANSSNNTIINAFGPASATTRSGTVLIGRDSSGTSASASADNEFALGTVNHTYLLPGRVGTVVEIGPNGTSTGQTGSVRLFELAANGTNYIGVRAPDNIASNINLTLPATVGSANQVLTTDGTSGVLSWATPSATVTGPIYSRSATGTATKIYAKTASDAVATRAVSTWSTPSYWSTASNANSVCWSPELGIFVSVGSQGTLIRASTSNDGVTWTTRATPESNTFNSVCWSPALGIFCAVSSTGTNRVMTSPDGINWIARAAASASSWRSVVWSPELGLFAAVAATTGATMYSSDGITWVAGTGTAGSFQYFSVTWSPELGLFVALGPGAVATSSNGTSWTETAVASLTATTNACVCWSPDLSLFVAVTDSSGVFATSTNGTTWIVRTSPASGNQWVCVTWSPEFGVFCASAITGTGTRLATSVDGINWTLRTNPVDNAWRSICWSPELGIFCAVSSTAAITNGAMVSRDVGVYKERKVVPKYFFRASQSSEAIKTLRTFTRRTNAVTQGNSFSAVCWSPELSLFVAFSDGANGNYLVTSPDGITWTTRTPSLAATIFTSVCWSAERNLFVAVANASSVNAISTSPDGITWTARAQTTATALQSVAWSPELGQFVAVGTNKIITSSDGLIWNDATSPASRAWKSVVWSSETNQFCAVAGTTGSTQVIMTSSNAFTWTTRTSIDTNGLQEVIWSPERGVFIATTNNSSSNHFAISYDGVTWSAVSVAGLTTLSIDGAAIWCAELGVFVASSYATIYISIDGINWASAGNLGLNTGLTVNYSEKVWSPELNQFVFLATAGGVNSVAISRKGNLLSEILNLRPSRLY
jgi:hypothetical protein